MKFLSEQAISRATRTTGRTVWFLSASGILLASGWIETKDFSIAGVAFVEGRLIEAFVAILLFSMLAHGVQWYGDLRSFQGWNIAGAKLVGLQFLGDKNTKTELEAFGQYLSQMFDVEFAKGEEKSEVEQSLLRARDALPEVAERLPHFVASVRDFGSFAIFYVYIWHCAAPILVGFVAIAKLRYA